MNFCYFCPRVQVGHPHGLVGQKETRLSISQARQGKGSLFVLQWRRLVLNVNGLVGLNFRQKSGGQEG